MAMGAFIYMRAAEPLPGELGRPDEVMEVFQRRSTECLIMANCSAAPGPYTMEALLMNIQNEFIRRRDAHLSVWLLAGLAIRCEWDTIVIRQFTRSSPSSKARCGGGFGLLDSLTSYQLGLPSMIQDPQCDTQLPSNLLDEDFGPHSVHLPASRPETEVTPILYTITKTRITTVFRAIYNRVTLARTESYEGIMVLHKRLLAARESMSPRMKMTRFSSSVTATPYLMIRRYNLELLFQKSFCLLHRQHMTKSYQDPTYNFSRRTCLEAAMTILQYQADIRRELHSGDAFHRSKWLATSLEQLDFLMASIIICLGLSSQARRQSSQAHENGEHGVSPYNQLQLLEALRSAHDFLDELKNISKDCQKAYNVISTMLQKFSSDGGSQADAHSPPVYPVPDMDVGMDVRPHPGQSNVAASSTISTDPSLETAPTQFSQPDFASSTCEGLDSFFNIADVADWDLWETFVRGPNIDGEA
ncbi:hypothetical protein LTR09_000844 [Extremus antarcticus]|uniref:Uncharacterized protein n=1 Tax=Extremus antarcticus TaxID=702011 RepID=A0AAJ0LWB6_9PEZI|nr:hypothetical protein LTR09_000844 [Extremus antarcticus]